MLLSGLLLKVTSEQYLTQNQDPHVIQSLEIQSGERLA
jgi:hypothetical protein